MLVIANWDRCYGGRVAILQERKTNLTQAVESENSEQEGAEV